MLKILRDHIMRGGLRPPLTTWWRAPSAPAAMWWFIMWSRLVFLVLASASFIGIGLVYFIGFGHFLFFWLWPLLFYCPLVFSASLYTFNRTADTKDVTDRQGIPRARHTARKNFTLCIIPQNEVNMQKVLEITCYHYRWKDPTLTIFYGLPSFVFHVFLDDFNTACPLPWCSPIVIWLLPPTRQNSFIIGIIDLFEK